jgi:hypothetical protein
MPSVAQAASGSTARSIRPGVWAAAVVLAVGVSAVILAFRHRASLSSRESAPPPAPQATGLADDPVDGYVLLPEPVGGIVAVHLPGGEETFVREPQASADTGQLPVHALAGPDSAGLLAFVEESMFPPSHSLCVIRLDGTGSRKVFTRAGDALWNHKVGTHLALSPVGGKVAFICNLRDWQVPGALLFQGPVEVWDVQTGASRRFDVAALDGPIAWLPDGRHLLYAKLVGPRDVEDLPLKPDGFGASYASWRQVPAVHVLDTNTGKERLLHVGEGPVVSPDGSFVVLQGRTSQSGAVYRVVWVDTGASTPVTIPGGRPVAILSRDVYLCFGAPGPGVPASHTKYYSPLVGPRPMLALNASTPAAGRFKTVVPDVDPRLSVSFGRTRRSVTAPATRGAEPATAPAR